MLYNIHDDEIDVSRAILKKKHAHKAAKSKVEGSWRAKEHWLIGL